MCAGLGNEVVLERMLIGEAIEIRESHVGNNYYFIEREGAERCFLRKKEDIRTQIVFIQHQQQRGDVSSSTSPQ